MPNTLEKQDWRVLLERINIGKCTPFLGAGVSSGALPLGSDIAQKWAKEHGYPLKDTGDLARVAQFLAVRYDPMIPKEWIVQEWFNGIDSPDFEEYDEPHGVLADLPLPMYMTTNYDDFMVQALRSQKRNPRQEFCRWNEKLKVEGSAFDDPGFKPTVLDPVVFHLHGHAKVHESLVLTEDDYLDFLVNISKDQILVPQHSKDSLVLPLQIREALAGTTLLFIGYGLADWDFRVLFRGLVTSREKSLRRLSFAVQLPPVTDDTPMAKRDEIQGYLDAYFNDSDVKVYWGKAREFAEELHKRWEDFSNGN